MAAPCTLGRARVDDMPGLLAHGARLGWPPRWEEPVPTPGTGVGLRLGGCACGGCPLAAPRVSIGGTTWPPGPRCGSPHGRRAPGRLSTPWRSATLAGPRGWRPGVTRRAGALVRGPCSHPRGASRPCSRPVGAGLVPPPTVRGA
jgi:hypothetical protein